MKKISNWNGVIGSMLGFLMEKSAEKKCPGGKIGSKGKGKGLGRGKSRISELLRRGVSTKTAEDKRSKSEVEYTDSSPSAKTCERCEYYTSQGACMKVMGDIDPDGLCRIWEARKTNSHSEEATQELVRNVNALRQ